ncbi:MAG TPA: enoyl-CoA hydratase-related protein [Bryobacteraceae bacterium]|nr:enoyl-CoA hydratase-related protein [Bryobacteraceae bacterium]
MNSYEQITYATAHRVATITLNRPDKLNAWTQKMEEEIGAAIRGAAADESVGVIVVTGAGKGFCAGADMSLLSAISQEPSPRAEFLTNAQVDGDVRADFRRKHAWLMAVPKPIIAAINGPAVGLGLLMTLYCDFRFASGKARFSVIFSKRGLVAEYGLAWILPRIVGLANAVELMYTSKMIDAEEALRMSLVSRIFPEENFAGHVQACAAELAATVSPRSLRIMKRQIYNGLFQTLGEAFDLSIEEMKASFGTEDFREGVAHFLEKRPAAFTGK